FGDGGAHEVAVALFAGSCGEESFPGGPGRLFGIVAHQGVLGEAVGGVVDGDDGVGDDPVGVGPRVVVADTGEGGSFDEFESGLQVVGLFDPRCLVGLADAVGELFDVAS
ncbi:hypothetical protein LCGC14_3154590, partial [marine sediment metagenome]